MSQLWPSSGKSNERPIELKSITKCFFQVKRFVPHCSPLLSIFLNMAFPNFETEFSFSCLFFSFSFSAFIAYWQWLGFSRSRKLQQVQVHATDLGSTAVCLHAHTRCFCVSNPWCQGHNGDRRPFCCCKVPPYLQHSCQHYIFWSHNTTNSNNNKYATHKTRDLSKLLIWKPHACFPLFLHHFPILPFFKYSTQ